MANDDQARKSAEDLIVSNHKALHTSYALFTNKQLADDTLKVKTWSKNKGTMLH